MKLTSGRLAATEQRVNSHRSERARAHNATGSSDTRTRRTMMYYTLTVRGPGEAYSTEIICECGEKVSDGGRVAIGQTFECDSCGETETLE